MNCPPEAQDNIILVGNKVDISDKRQVSTEEGQDLCSRLNLLAYYEASA
jgi:hypothetical protein